MVRGLALHLLVACLALRAAAQQPAAAGAPVPNPFLDAEFTQLNELLDEMATAFGAWRGFCGPDPGSVLAARLAVFPMHFGTDPRTLPQWNSLRDHAARVLDGVGSSGLPQTGDTQDVSGQMDRYVLLQILGLADQAQQILDGVSTKGSDGCIWCTAENSVVVNQRRSENAERSGDANAALKVLHESALDVAALDWEPAMFVAGEDLLRFRYGYLLALTGHADVGTTALRDLARTRSTSLGGRLAGVELHLLHVSEDVTRARYLARQIQGGMAYESCAVVVVWTTDDPTSMHWIAARLPGQLDGEWTRTVAFDDVAFETVRPLLERGLGADLLGPSIDSLTLLHGLAGGAERYVDAFLDRLSDCKDTKSALALEIDERLRWMHGGGPAMSLPLGQCNWRSISEDWKRWRQTTGKRTRAAR